jgi:hypothetical protein
MPQETETVFSGIPSGNGTYRYSGAHSKYTSDGNQKRWNGSAWVPMGGGRKSRRNARTRRNSKKSKRVRYTRRKQTRRHRHSRRR